jgi:hypothetical protein
MTSSPLLHIPSTPLSSHTKYPVLGLGYQPLNSSPLASPSPKSSPVAAVQARRRLQFKARTSSTPVASSSRSFPSARSITCSGESVFGGGVAPGPVEAPQKTFLRERFRARCFERAARAREKAVSVKRYASEASSDGFDEAMDDEDEEDDDDIMQDEVRFNHLPLLIFRVLFSLQLFSRIMANASSKQRHSYRVSYAHDVGSSFDPDLEDIDEWERELDGLRFSQHNDGCIHFFFQILVILPIPRSIQRSLLFCIALISTMSNLKHTRRNAQPELH